MYKYYCTGRPAMLGTIPKENLISVQNFDARQQFHFCKAWAIVTYSKPLDKRTLDAYELSENKPEPDQYIELEKIDPIVFFRGTEKEQAAEEKKEERNKKWLKALYKETLSGNIDYFYTRKETANGYENYKVIHKSAKYKDGLQLTALSFLNGEFAYMTYDVLIADFKRLESELCITGGKIYFGNLETANKRRECKFMKDRTKAERMHKVTRAFSALNEIENESGLKKEGLTLAEYHAISENIRAFGSCRPDAKTETIYSGIADFFSRYGFTVKHSGIGYSISF